MQWHGRRYLGRFSVSAASAPFPFVCRRCRSRKVPRRILIAKRFERNRFNDRNLSVVDFRPFRINNYLTDISSDVFILLFSRFLVFRFVSRFKTSRPNRTRWTRVTVYEGFSKFTCLTVRYFYVEVRENRFASFYYPRKKRSAGRWYKNNCSSIVSGRKFRASSAGVL